eukprot:1185829-Prorocentrum_minimum.AAC.4
MTFFGTQLFLTIIKILHYGCEHTSLAHGRLNKGLRFTWGPKDIPPGRSRRINDALPRLASRGVVCVVTTDLEEDGDNTFRPTVSTGEAILFQFSANRKGTAEVTSLKPNSSVKATIVKVADPTTAKEVRFQTCSACM